MKDIEKMSYLVQTCCINSDDVKQLNDWIQHTSLDFVYEMIHYMFDQDDTLEA